MCHKKNEDLLDNGNSFSIITNMIAINMMIQWMTIIILCHKKDEDSMECGDYFCITKKNSSINEYRKENYFGIAKK